MSGLGSTRTLTNRKKRQSFHFTNSSCENQQKSTTWARKTRCQPPNYSQENEQAVKPQPEAHKINPKTTPSSRNATAAHQDLPQVWRIKQKNEKSAFPPHGRFALQHFSEPNALQTCPRVNLGRVNISSLSTFTPSEQSAETAGGKTGVFVVLVTAPDGGVKLEGVQRNQDEKRGNHWLKITSLSKGAGCCWCDCRKGSN